VPALAYVAYVGLQLASWPLQMLARVAPPTAAVWQARLVEPPLADGMPSTLPLSLYPDATAHCLPLLLSGVVLFIVAVQLYRDPKRVRRLCVVVVGLGALLAAAQTLDNLSGVATPTFSAGPFEPLFGAFVHYGHYAEFLNLALGCAFALLLSRFCHRSGAVQNHAAAFLDDLRWPGRGVDRALLAGVLLLVFAVTVSSSRMGLISMCCAGGLLAALLQRTRVLRGTSWLFGAVVVITVAALTLTGKELIYDRFTAVAAPGGGVGGRVALFRDSAAMFAHFPSFGVGHGAYEYVFPMFDEATRGGRAQHAENLYIELLAEGGLVGALLQLAFVGLVVRSWSRVLRGPIDASRAGAVGLVFGAVAVLTHGLTDFGLRVPAVGLTLLLCTAAATAPSSTAWSSRSGRAFVALIGLVAGLALAMSVPKFWCAHRADTLWREAEAIASSDDGDDPTAADVVDQQAELVEAALRLRPGHAEFQLRRAALSFQRALVRYSVAVEGSASRGSAPELVRAAAKVAQEQALAARRHAPTYGLFWSLAGQLGVQWLEQPSAGDWIVRGMDMSPESPEACLAAAAYLLGRDDAQAAAAFTRAVQVGADQRRLMTMLLSDADRPDVAAAVAFDDPDLLVSLLPRLRENPSWGEVAADVRRRALDVLEEVVERGDARALHLEALGRLQVEDGDLAAGASMLRRALVLEPDRRSRLLLADVLDRQGDRPAAIRELERLLLHRPRMRQAVEQLRRLQGR